MKHFIQLLLISLFCACSFESPEKETENPTIEVPTGDRSVTVDPSEDSDGDMISDGEELRLGLNPFVADIPKVRTRFLQNYSIEFKWKEHGQSSGKEMIGLIDTRIRNTNPDFKYRVGDSLLRDLSFKQAASVGRFETHSWGEHQPFNLSWIGFPQVDESFYHDQSIKYKSLFDAEIHVSDIKIKIENVIRLMPQSRYRTIKNPTIAFRYYDYTKESYEIIHQETIERTLQAGVNETIEVVIENAPYRLLKDNFFRKGEFLISELVDYEIPELGVTYKTLLRSIQNKSVPVLHSTPLESEVYYVSLKGKARFHDILSRLFDSKFTIENNQLTKIEQFENNLNGFSQLKDMRDENKRGRWYVFTNKLLRHYLDHTFTNSDVISLSYIVGSELSRQVDEKVFAFYPGASGLDHEVDYPLGNITPNSQINIQLKGGQRWGDKLTRFKEEFHTNGANCRGNCSNSDIHCYWEVNKFEPRFETFDLSTEFNEEIENLSILVNREEFSLKELREKKLASISWTENSLNLTISNINQLIELKPTDENVIKLRVRTTKGDDFNGVKLVKMEGRQYYYCPAVTTEFAFHSSLPISNESLEFGQWRSSVHWDRIKLGERKHYSFPFSVQVMSSIENYFN
jgi:hypothetical protein